MYGAFTGMSMSAAMAGAASSADGNQAEQCFLHWRLPKAGVPAIAVIPTTDLMIFVPNPARR
jgi:hypothetical protein